MYEWQAIIKSSGRPQCVRRGVRGNPAALTDVEAEPNGTNLSSSVSLTDPPSLPFLPGLLLFFARDRLAIDDRVSFP